MLLSKILKMRGDVTELNELSGPMNIIQVSKLEGNIEDLIEEKIYV